MISSIVAQIGQIVLSSEFPTNCSKCVAGLSVAKNAALLAPELVPETMVALCKQYQLHSNSTCETDFSAHTFGAIWTQVSRCALPSQIVTQAVLIYGRFSRLLMSLVLMGNTFATALEARLSAQHPTRRH